MNDDLSPGDREERPARLRSKHAYEGYKLVKIKREINSNGPLIPFYVWIVNETSKHLRKRATGKSDCESTLFVNGVSLRLFNINCE